MLIRARFCPPWFTLWVYMSISTPYNKQIKRYTDLEGESQDKGCLDLKRQGKLICQNQLQPTDS